MNSALLFLDTEFTPVTRQWLSLGAVVGDRFFYAETSDAQVLELARAEFAGSALGGDVLGQLGAKRFPPGALSGLADLGRAFEAWVNAAVRSPRLDLCYDYSHDMALLEQAMAGAGLAWPDAWQPCNLAILNEDPVADAAKARVWAEFKVTRGIRRHHALADAAALQAAYFAQTGPSR